jgi:uncharacterized cupredoxin-like copper-binding protein
VRFSRPLLVPAVILIALLGAACGDDDTDTTAANDAGGSGERTVEVRMADNDFDPASIEVERGETVTFMFENTGAVDHDALIGDAEAQAEHEAEMNSTAGDDMGGEMGDHSASGDDALTVAPGETGELTYTFDQSGQLEIGCHEPGHYDAGMRILVSVT